MANDCINALRISATTDDANELLGTLRPWLFESGGRLWIAQDFSRRAKRSPTSSLSNAICTFVAGQLSGYPRIVPCEGHVELRFESRWDPPRRAVAALARRIPDRTLDLLHAEPLMGLAGQARYAGGRRVDEWQTTDFSAGEQRLIALGFDHDAVYREAMDLEWSLLRQDPSWTPEMEAFRAQLRAMSDAGFGALRDEVA